MLVFNKDDYILGLWTVETGAANVLLTAYKREGAWYLYSRYRVYVDTKVFEESKDPRHSWQIEFKKYATERLVLNTVREAVKYLTEGDLKGASTHERLIRSSDMEKFRRALESLPGVHIRKESIH